MDLIELHARRTESEEHLPTRWAPVDIVCQGPAAEAEEDPPEILVRTKLVRDVQTAAVCLSEAISHRILHSMQVAVAEAFAVAVDAEFAASLTTQYGFETAVTPGRHWGTRFIADAVEDVIREEHFDLLADPEVLFVIYLADVVLGYRDRQTHGNILLVPAESGHGRLDIVAIDQSDCFCGPDCLCSPVALADAARKGSYAQPFAGMERLVIGGGSELVDRLAERVLGNRDAIFAAVSVPPDEWYDRAGIEPDHVSEFLRYRVDNLEKLARLDYWRGMAVAAQGDDIVLL